MKYYTIDPDVPGRLSDETIKALRIGTPKLVNYIFECWPTSDLVQADPVFLVSNSLASALSSAGLSGFCLKPCVARKGEQFNVTSLECGELPSYRWLVVDGLNGVDDFFISQNLMLTVSERALKVMNAFSLDGADVEES